VSHTESVPFASAHVAARLDGTSMLGIGLPALLMLILATRSRGLPGVEPTFPIVAVTVLQCVLAHGAAAPLTARYARSRARSGPAKRARARSAPPATSP
jgi:hypothetical protein